MAVYFVQAGKDGPIKIGATSNLKKRLVGMQTGCPERLTVLAIDESASEKVLHRQFSTERIAGEWFKPTETLLALIDRLPPRPLTISGRRPLMEQAHPLRVWRLAHQPELDLDAVADRLASAGDERPSPAYLRHIENGVNSPGWELAKRIATLIGADAAAVKDWSKTATPGDAA